jgi:biopolymer transport protein ExbB/TolQ
MSIFSLFVKGGILMWVLLAISFVVIALVIEKYRAISRARKQNEKLLNALQSQDKLDSIKSVLRIYGEETPLCQILSKLTTRICPMRSCKRKAWKTPQSWRCTSWKKVWAGSRPLLLSLP